ncbi:MAG: DNA-directed RNA polymerase subunit beta [Chloroflexi bacterium ADurb.Bin180]|nr:MAG: DNA-directed RNA polymerase subunit beta [Chloroflexi bacterium ADurb.Bin180]
MTITATLTAKGSGSTSHIRSYARIPDVYPLPNLIEMQVQSYEWFKREGLQELFEEVSPIVSYGGDLELSFLGHRFEEPKYSEEECRTRDMTLATPLYVTVQLKNNGAGGEISEQEVYMGDFPLMTEQGTFVINGAERVVVSQLIRSPGAYFTVEEEHVTGRRLCMAKLIPNRGAWLEGETSRRDVLSVKVDRKRKLPITVLLRATGVITDVPGAELIQAGTDEELLNLFAAVDTTPEHPYLARTIERDPTKDARSALEEFYKKMRPGDPATFENARSYLSALLFNPRRYDLGKVGRYKLNRRLGLEIPQPIRILTKLDLVKIVERMILVNNGVGEPDDIDHLGNRRIKTVGELIQNQLRVGLLRMERMVRDRMSTRGPEQLTPMGLINIRPVVAVMREFFGGSQLSQFMDQTNPLAELTHKRRLSALGPGGLRRERAGFDVRDVHHSHYGRICPIETPEGPNIGLIGSLSSYARVNEYGFVETPYRRVLRNVTNQPNATVGLTLREAVTHPDTGEVIAEAGTLIDEDLALRLAEAPLKVLPVEPTVTNDVVYLTADQEDQHVIAQAGTRVDEHGRLLDKRTSVRFNQRFMVESADRVDYMDVSPKQIVSVSAALIPFLEHDDANRALMGSNMQRQAVPLLRPEVPVVGTGMERQSALDSGQVVLAAENGEVVSSTGREVVVRNAAGKNRTYSLRRYNRSNQSTCLDQRPIVSRGDRVVKGTALADSSSTDNGELALGQNVLVAFVSWEGGNYEDAILVSEQLVRDDKFSSIHIEKHEVEARETKLGPEEITRDIPNVGEDALRNLDEEGIIHVGAEVGPGDILVGKITPKGETELSPEEKLLRAIFGEKAWEVKDSSLRLPHGERGKVVEVRVFSRDEHRDMSAGVDKMVRVSVAQQRKVSEGDKMAGRHGNKGVISRIVPIEDMPYLADGTPVDIILNPLGVPARMNVGQILETHLGWAADRLGFRAVSPVFDGADEAEIAGELSRAWLSDRAWSDLQKRAWAYLAEQQIDTESLEDDWEAVQDYMRQNLDESDAEDLDEVLRDPMASRLAWLRHWLTEKGLDAERLCPGTILNNALPEAQESSRLATLACLRLWLSDLGVDVSGIRDEQLELEARKASEARNIPLPTSGKAILYNGKTGEPFDRPVTVGVIYMMKLAHLVEDKVHARSTGPYSLVTQQPLGGKAQQGGQRFGEMEVWALEAYGAAHTLQEMLTVKSDDVNSRVKAYEAIVKGERIQEPSIPESFRVLVKELQGLGLAVQVLNENGELVQFGRDESEDFMPKLGLGLGLPGYARRPRVG